MKVKHSTIYDRLEKTLEERGFVFIELFYGDNEYILEPSLAVNVSENCREIIIEFIDDKSCSHYELVLTETDFPVFESKGPLIFVDHMNIHCAFQILEMVPIDASKL